MKAHLAGLAAILVTGALAPVFACGGGSPADADGGGLDGGAQGDGACGAAACVASPDACGSVRDACGNVVSCGLCRFTGESSEGASGNIALALTPTPQVANGNAVLTPATSGTWASSAFSTAAQVETLGLALASDGTPWVVYSDSQSMKVAHLAGGTWAVEPLPSAGVIGDAAIVLAPDGTPTALYGGYVSNAPTVVLARRVNGAWTTTSVATPSGLFANVALTISAGETQLAWQDLKNGVMFAHGTGAGPFTTEVVDATAVGTSQIGAPIGASVYELAIATDASGAVHLAYKNASDEVTHAVRTNGTWSHETIPRLSMYSKFSESGGQVRLAISASGRLVVGTTGDVLSLLSLVGGTWLEQPVAAHCDSTSAGLDMAFDASGHLAIAHTCGSAAHLMLESGPYPADYATACDQIVAGWCSQACSCPKDATGKCCIVGSSQGICFDGPSLCQGEFVVPPCADATLDPTVVYACRDAVTQTTQPTCTAPDAGNPGMLVPSACSALY